jgi:hypothetical protein
MKELLPILLRLAGAGLILLAVLHIPIGRRLGWREDAARMSPVNASVFHVHTFFICVVLLMMALPCLFEPMLFLEPSRAGVWMAFSFSGFWTLRLYCQWFVYPAQLWRHRPLETVIHGWFTVVWLGLALLFGSCGALQVGWLSLDGR